VPTPSTDFGARHPLGLVLGAGLLVAILDGILASMIYVVVLQVITVPQLFQSIAHAVLGKAAFEGGMSTAAVGLAMHYGVALTWSLVYWLAWRRWPTLRRFRARYGAVAMALLYGPMVWVIMDLVVMPFTRNRVNSPLAGMFWVMLAGHVLSVGLPIAVTIHPEVLD
jgi:hypothetical protein